MAKALDKSLKITELRKRAEERLKTTRRDIASMSVKDVQRLVHELQVHQIELDMQNNELRRTNIELEEARDRYMDFYNFSPAGQITLDVEDRIIEANLRARTLVGIGRETLIGQSFARFVAQDSQDIFHWHRRRVLETGTRQTCQIQLQKKTGAPSWVYLESLVVCKEPEQVTHWKTALLDISEQKRTEGALRLAKFAMERTADAVYWIDSQAKILDVNEAASLMLGYSKGELCTMTVHDLSPDFQADRWPGFWAETQRRGTMVIETSHRTKDGRVIPVEVSGNYLFYEGKEYHCAFVRNITEHKRLEAQFRQAQKMEAVGRLAGGVAHDFNNLLTIINGYSALLVERLSQDSPLYEMAAETLRAGERAGELTKQLLAFSRKQVLMPQPLNVNDSLRLISSMLSRLLGEEVTLTMDLAPDLWSINGDKGQLNQVTMNLAINARDAMPHGGTLTIATRNLSVTPEQPDRYGMMPPGDYVHVSVCDSGQGMSPETLSHLFEPFLRRKRWVKERDWGWQRYTGL